MSDDNWDAEDYEPPSFGASSALDDRWEGEDEEDIPDDWMAGEDSKPNQDETNSAAPVKKKKSLAERIAEKEVKRQEELAERRKREAEAEANMTPEQVAAEKLRRRQLDEEADLELAKDAFGVSEADPVVESSSLLDSLPSTKEEFDTYREALVTRLKPMRLSAHYVSFVEDLSRALCNEMDSEDVKKVTAVLNALYNEKNKIKQNKNKKKKGAKLNVERTAVDDYEDFF